jgi:hypothetical protein
MSCSKEKETDYVAQNEEEISAYVAKQFDRSERFRIVYINNSGTGLDLLQFDCKRYKGYFTDGSVFDEFQRNEAARKLA